MENMTLPWKSGFAEENVADLAKLIPELTLSLPLLITETTEGVPGARNWKNTHIMLAPEAWGVGQGGHYGIRILTTKGNFEYAAHVSGLKPVFFEVEMHKLTFVFWNDKNEKVIHTYEVWE